MSQNKELSLLGLAKKAGRLAVGNEPVLEALHTGRAELLVFASDAADNTIRRFENRRGEVPAVTLPYTKEILGAAIGYKSCAAAAITDRGFSAAFQKALAAQPDPMSDECSHKKSQKTNNN